MNEIVKYDNSFNNLPLKNFTATELDLLMCLCSKMREKDTKEIIFSFEQLKSLSKYKPTANSRFIKDLMSTNEKLIQLHFKIKTENMIYQFVLFPTFIINQKDLTLTIGVNEKFKFILNNLTSNFTRFELQEFIDLKSEYSKKLYRLLKQYKSSGLWKVSVEEFNRIMDIPKSYTTSITNRDIINPCIKELNQYFKNLECKKIRANKRGQPIIAYEFTFLKDLKNKYSSSELPDDRKYSNERIAFLAGACNYEFSDEEMIQILEVVGVVDEAKLPVNVPVDDINLRMYHYLAERYAALNVEGSKKTIKRRFAYFITMLKSDV